MLEDLINLIAFSYDQHLERYDVALRAIWHLAATARYDLLDELGLGREEVERGMYAVRIREGGRMTERQCFEFVRECPRSLSAAQEMMRRYAAVSADDRAQWYGRAA